MLFSCNKTPKIDTTPTNNIQSKPNNSSNNTKPKTNNIPSTSKESKTGKSTSTSKKTYDNVYDDGIDDWGTWHT